MNAPAHSERAAVHEDPAAARSALRHDLRARRRHLPAAQRRAAAQAIAKHIAATRWLQRSRAIGLYVSVGAEVSTAPLQALAQRRHCRIYLPRIVDYRRRDMVFVRAHEAPVLPGRYGIPEPDGTEILPARALSVVFVPLLGFDARGSRLGSGAGYYDRLFAFRRHRHSWHRPLLVGLAYVCQRLEHIQTRSHDVPLDAVVTPDGIEYCGRAAPNS